VIGVIRRAARDRRFWLLLFLAWFGTLWILSSRSGEAKDLPEIPHFDKVAHFGYFSAGGFLFAGFLSVGRNRAFPLFLPVVIVGLVIGGVGILDEFHQSFTPGRNGNDPFDWLADLLGGFCGSLAFRKFESAIIAPSDDSSRS
jgi:VanZ family protein